MAKGSSGADNGHRLRWPLLASCALFAVFLGASIIDVFGLGGTPWFGFWDVVGVPSGEPFVLQYGPPDAGGGAARDGLRAGDRVDLRRQTLEARLRLPMQPMSTEAFALTVSRGNRTLELAFRGGSVWSGNAALKIVETSLEFLTSALFLVCALLVVVRRSSLAEGRALAVIMLSQADNVTFVFPSALATLGLSVAGQLFSFGAMGLLVHLASRFGVRARWRSVVEVVAYAAIAVNALELLAGVYGLVTLRLDPMVFGFESTSSGAVDILSAVESGLVALATIAAVASTSLSDRPRAAWLLLPLSIALAIESVLTYCQSYAATWFIAVVILVVAQLALFAGALAVTYAILRRRVLDVEFVLSRTLGVAGVSLIVLSAFVLLEWLLGTVLAGASHASGLIANAALALVLGVSLSFIHQRVDRLIEATLFRKRHEDERALRNFAREAAFVTSRDALLEQTIDKLRRHTDALSAAVLVHDGGAYRAVQTYGAQAAVVDENDAAILALKTWHAPLDPHRYITGLGGALALPMIARGHLLGVLLCGERAGGVAFASDEIEALAEFAHGVGAAYDAMSEPGDSNGNLRESIVSAMQTSLSSFQDAIVTELRARRES